MRTTHQPCNDCGSSDALTIYVDSTYCFSCGRYRKTTPKGVVAPKSAASSIKLPEDLEVLHSSHRAFLLDKGIDSSLATCYNIKYSPSMHRLIIPSYDGGKLIGWQGRALEHSYGPKYIQGVGQCPKYFISNLSDGVDTRAIVIVEDALSAMKVGQVMRAFALIGTKLDAQGVKLARILSEQVPFIVWLDSDKPGKDGARNLIKRLNNVGHVVKQIISTADPKLATLTEIKEVIYG